MFEAVRELFTDEFKEAEERGISIGEKRGISIGEKRGAEQLRLTKNIFKLALSGSSVSDIAKQCNVSEDYVRETLE